MRPLTPSLLTSLLTASLLCVSLWPLPAAAGPVTDDQLKAIATAVRTWRAKPAGSPQARSMEAVVLMLVLSTADVTDPAQLTPEAVKALEGTVARLKALKADPSELTDKLLTQAKKRPRGDEGR